MLPQPARQLTLPFVNHVSINAKSQGGAKPRPLPPPKKEKNKTISERAEAP